MNVPTIMPLTKNHIAHLCLFALMIPFLQSCLHEDIDHAKIREIEKQFEMEYIVINDTERDCSMEWFYDSLNGEDSRSQQIKAGEKWVVFGGDRREPYCAKRIVFSFSGELTLSRIRAINIYTSEKTGGTRCLTRLLSPKRTRPPGSIIFRTSWSCCLCQNRLTLDKIDIVTG